LLGAGVAPALLIVWWWYTASARKFKAAIGHADQVLLHEGLPHPVSERKLFLKEHESKSVKRLFGYDFYPELLAISAKDAETLTELLSETKTFARNHAFAIYGKRCFLHPDYAVEWHCGADRYLALLCFGCREVKLYGPGVESYHDLAPEAFQALQGLLRPTVTNDLLGRAKRWLLVTSLCQPAAAVEPVRS
jgi:hypothetical protein